MYSIHAKLLFYGLFDRLVLIVRMTKVTSDSALLTSTLLYPTSFLYNKSDCVLSSGKGNTVVVKNERPYCGMLS